MAATRTVREGVIVGLIAYASVAVFYVGFDLLASRGTLYTVDLLGRAVFRGLRDPSILQFPIQPDLVAVSLYNALHLVLSLAIGLIVTWLVGYAEAKPARTNWVLVVIIAGFVNTILLVGWLTTAMRPVLPWWSIVVANALAVVFAATYLMHTRPGILRRMVPFAR